MTDNKKTILQTDTCEVVFNTETKSIELRFHDEPTKVYGLGFQKTYWFNEEK